MKHLSWRKHFCLVLMLLSNMEGKCSHSISAIVPHDNLLKHCLHRNAPLMYALATMKWACWKPSCSLGLCHQFVFSRWATFIDVLLELSSGPWDYFYRKTPYNLMSCLQNFCPSLLRVFFPQNVFLSFKFFSESKPFFIERR